MFTFSFALFQEKKFHRCIAKGIFRPKMSLRDPKWLVKKGVEKVLESRFPIKRNGICMRTKTDLILWMRMDTHTGRHENTDSTVTFTSSIRMSYDHPLNASSGQEGQFVLWTTLEPLYPVKCMSEGCSNYFYEWNLLNSTEDHGWAMWWK